MPEKVEVPAQADGVFEGGGVKGIAFAGAIKAAEEEGIREWVNVAGSSAGAITASLLAVGYTADEIERALAETNYRLFADYGPGGKYLSGPLNYLRLRGLVPGRYFKQWLGERFEAKLGNPSPTFKDVIRKDLPDNLSEAELRRAKYKLKVIASDITSGRMLVLPDHIADYEDKDGNRFTVDEFPLVEAVRMSMSFPFFFDVVTLYRDGKPHYIVDGGLLSNFPVWLFDSGDRPPRPPQRGFRRHGRPGPPRQPDPTITPPVRGRALLKAMFFSAMEAWDREQLGRTTAARTVSIPTRDVKTINFDLPKEQADSLYRWGYEETKEFFASPETQAYLAKIQAARQQAPA